MDTYMLDEVLPGTIPDITAMTDHELDIAMAYYRMGMEAGRSRGYDAGYRSAEEDIAALQRTAVAFARAAASSPTYAQLADMRGDHDRAERARADQQRIDKAPTPSSPRPHSTAVHGPDEPGRAQAPPEVPMEVAALNRIRQAQLAAGYPDLRPRANLTSPRPPATPPPPTRQLAHAT